MGRLERGQEQLYYAFNLDDAVPQDHQVRSIAAVLDLSWVHGALAPHYSNLGRPSIDPELMLRMLILGYVFAIRSARFRRYPIPGSLYCAGFPQTSVRPRLQQGRHRPRTRATRTLSATLCLHIRHRASSIVHHRRR
jgi:hypothetical protein